jgi:hypothetical protein
MCFAFLEPVFVSFFIANPLQIPLEILNVSLTGNFKPSTGEATLTEGFVAEVVPSFALGALEKRLVR